jgi:holo-[acyl-carrier protein] synthase
MTLATGIDLIEIERVQRMIDDYGKRFLQRIFTLQELTELGENVDSLAGRFAAKEAVAKALGTGIGAVAWGEIEILRGPQRQPILHLHGAAARLAEKQGLNEWSVSISHTQTHAVAVAVGHRVVE